MPNPAARKELYWTPELVQRYWDYNSGRENEYFALKFGGAIAQRFSGYLRPEFTLLDYGCGSGALINHLLKQAARVYGVDASEESVALVRQRFSHHDRFGGAITTAQLYTLEQPFDLVISVEVVEHLYDDPLKEMLRSVEKCLKPGGLFIVTCPNREDLLANMLYCPNCDRTFHRWQHVRTWDRDSLPPFLESQGFRVLSISETDFGAAWSQSRRRYLRNVRRRIFRRKFPLPHLACVAQKPNR